MILYNPDNGAPIKDFIYLGMTYFNSRDEQPFMPGTVFQFEDDKIGNEFIHTFGFLQEVTPSQAKKIMASTPLKCEHCDFSTRVQNDFDLHSKTHTAAKELSDMGIPMVKKVTHLTQYDNQKPQTNIQKQIDGESVDLGDGYPGLTEGPGLTKDGPTKSAIMS